MTDDEAEAAYRGEGKRYFAFMLLEAKQAYMHEVGYGESGAQRVDIARHHASCRTRRRRWRRSR